MSAPDWATLTTAQQSTLVTTPVRTVDVGCELLNFDLTVAEDISEDLDVSNGGDVTWDGTAQIHRDCDVSLARELDWGIALIRLYMTVTDQLSGLAARRNVGVFCLTTPDTALGETVLHPDGSQSLTYKVTGQDRLYLLARQVGYSYTVPAGTSVLTAVSQVFTDAGLTGALIDATAAASTVPSDMVWPMVATDGDQATVNDGSTGPTLWLDVVNDLLALISYRGVWADENGLYRSGPLIDPATAAPTFTFDSDSVTASTVAINRTVTRDLWAAPNKWIFIWANMPPDLSGNPQTPTVGNGGIYIVTNTSDGPSSVTARDGLVWPTQISLNAADAASLTTQGDLRVAADKRALGTVKLSTATFPAASHSDVFTWTDAALTDDDGTWKVQATSWTVHLDGSDTEWAWSQVA